MTITVKVPDDVASAPAKEAARQALTPDQLAARVLAEHIPTRRRLGFVAAGQSSSRQTAEQAEEVLAQGFGR